MKYIHIDNEEYYEDRFSDCCDLPIFFQTDICVGCQKHTTFKIKKMTIELSDQNLDFLEDMLIGQLELFEKEGDDFSKDYCEKINKLLKEIQKQL